MTSKRIVTLIGIVLALFGPLIPALGAGHESSLLAAGLMGHGLLWAFFLGILLVVHFLEKQPLSSIGFTTFRLRSLTWGIGLYAINLFISIVQIPIQNHLRVGFQPGIDRLSTLPTWYMVFAVITAGIVEETLYRGYGLSRMEMLVGNPWLAGLIVQVIFGAVHIPAWGLGTAVAMTIAGIPIMAIFIWKRDLYAFMLAHVLSDATGLIIVPRLLDQTP